ncbi:uncharacterized protein LOC132257868 [Phlebotomus argentipes]|uniref:uncharacterized protein LOC132257868 n=1 Tax=Phlebotomus argentipes TaxID=94469 RepID=UPI0028937B80|nr:uncharacterized protein LOC132257868 [Phlebotomus argentipes]
MVMYRVVFLVALLAPGFTVIRAHSTQRPAGDEPSPFLDMASAFLTEALANQGGGNGGIGGIASVIGSLMQSDSSSGKSGDNGAGAILAGIGSLLANSAGGSRQGGGGGFDPALIGNIIEMFSSSSGDNSRQKKQTPNQQEPSGWDTVLNIASAFLGNQGQQQARSSDSTGDNLMSLLPMVLQTINSFSGPEGLKTQEKHKDHALLPPFLENIHVMWDHFSQSELAQIIWTKSGISQVFKGFTGRDGKLDYNKLFKSLENQSFRRRWIKTATVYLADWANYIADPEVYQRYFHTAQLMANGFLKSQNLPLIDPSRASETLAQLIDAIAKKHLSVKISSKTYVKPAMNYVKELLKLGQARGLLQKFNATEISDKLTDTVNLEIIEPVLKVYRSYRYILGAPQCDKFVMCDINSHDPSENFGLAGFKAGITKFGSLAASWVLSGETKTPFWTLFSIVSDPGNCQVRFPVDCSGFHEGEARVTTEYVHNEL